ncbi:MULTISPECIES: MaoC family dehydratase [Staphylococcus]|uniref:MaoC family dehydratase n=1 Tax=Staphylococcus TaxID=1279 RepID=UPI002E17DA28|nr:MaoC family dehydratase [Staphylococcus shinii]
MKLDEFEIDDVFTTPPNKISEEDIINFAQEFDPQYMHLDKEKATQGRFNGIIASGIHTLSISFKLWIEAGKYGEDVIAGTHMNHIKFIKPVYPEDELYTKIKVLNKQATKRDQGLLTVLLSTFNQYEDKVFEGELTALLRR